MMASTISNIPTKTSVERKPRDGYRFTIDIGTVNAWQFDLTDSELEEFLRQVTRAHGPVLGSCVETPESTNKPAQANTPQPGAIYMGTLGTPGVNTLSFVSTPDAEKIQLSANTPQPPPTGNGRKSYYDHPTIDGLQAIDVIQDFSYNVATAIAYLWRWGRKPNTDPLEDGRKAIQHIEFECERLKAQRPTPPSAFAGLRGKFGGAFDDF